MSAPTSSGHRPLLAACLGLACTGLGHVYCGRTALGIGLFLASLLFAPLVLLLTALGPSTAALALLLTSTGAVLALYLFGAAHAALVARSVDPDAAEERRGELRRPQIYLLFLLVGVSYPIVTGWMLRASVLQGFRCATISMEPTLLDGDRMLASKLAVNRIQRGDVVVFRPPGRTDEVHVKRVVALSGQRVAMRDGIVAVDGVALVRAPAPAAERTAPPGEAAFLEWSGETCYRVLVPEHPPAEEADDFVVPPRHCYVLGDRRGGSLDSRHFGAVPLEDVIGRVDYRVLPAKDWTRFGNLYAADCRKR